MSARRNWKANRTRTNPLCEYSSRCKTVATKLLLMKGRASKMYLCEDHFAFLQEHGRPETWKSITVETVTQ